jgi:hypothetical protein
MAKDLILKMMQEEYRAEIENDIEIKSIGMWKLSAEVIEKYFD